MHVVKKGVLIFVCALISSLNLFGQSTIPAIPASFLGGETAMVQWISSNLKYPIEAQEASVEGTLYTWLLIDTSGKAHVKGFIGDTLGYGCEKSVRQMISNMPLWIPSHGEGKKLVYENLLPLRFSLPKEKKQAQSEPQEHLTMPQFKGGEQALVTYLKDSMRKYSKERKGAKGELYIEFFVEQDGRIVDAWITKSNNTELDNIGLKMVREMPHWTPGSLNGEAVRILSSLSIRFD